MSLISLTLVLGGEQARVPIGSSFDKSLGAMLCQAGGFRCIPKLQVYAEEKDLFALSGLDARENVDARVRGLHQRDR